MEFYGELRRNRKWNGKGYDINGNLIFEDEYLNGKKMEKEKNMIIMVNEY